MDHNYSQMYTAMMHITWPGVRSDAHHMSNKELLPMGHRIRLHHSCDVLTCIAASISGDGNFRVTCLHHVRIAERMPHRNMVEARTKSMTFLEPWLAPPDFMATKPPVIWTGM